MSKRHTTHLMIGQIEIYSLDDPHQPLIEIITHCHLCHQDLIRRTFNADRSRAELKRAGNLSQKDLATTLAHQAHYHRNQPHPQHGGN